MPPHDENWTVKGPLRWRDRLERPWGSKTQEWVRDVQVKWEFYCFSCGLVDIIWVEKGKLELELDGCPGCGTESGHWVAKPLPLTETTMTTTVETTTVRNDCDQCGHHRSMHQYGNCVECEKLTQNGVCLPGGTCYTFVEPGPLEVGIGGPVSSDLSHEQSLQVDRRIDINTQELKTNVELAKKAGMTAKEMSEKLGISVSTVTKQLNAMTGQFEDVTKQFEELKPHMDKAKAEHERRKEFAMTLKGYIAAWLKHQPPVRSYMRRDAFSNGYRACVETGANARPGEAWIAYRAWLVRLSLGALNLRWTAWSAGWRTAEDHYKRKRAELYDVRSALSCVAIDGPPINADSTPIEYIDMDGNSHETPPDTPFAEVNAKVDEIDKAQDPFRALFTTHARADHTHPTHQEESDQSMIPAIRPDAHQLALELVAAHEAPWVPKAGETAYIKETFEGPFVLLERLNEETVITFLNPLQDSDDAFLAAKLPVGTKAWLVQPKTGKPRTILEPLLTNQKPPRGQFFAKLGGALSSRFFGAVVQAAGFGTLVYLLLR